MNLLKSLVVLLVLSLIVSAQAAERLTVELKKEVDLLTQSSSGDMELVEELAPETILRFRTDTATGSFYRHIFILSSPNLSQDEIAEINKKPLFVQRNILQKSRRYESSGATFDRRTGQYNITNQAQRRDLVEKIIDRGPRVFGSTLMRMPDGELYEVLNDHVTLEDGTYVPFTFPEARRMAREWGYEIPNATQARAIADLAARSGNQFKAITRTPNNGEASQLKSMNQMMNDSRMRQRAEAGRSKLIDGHFKWYTNTGKIYGFAKGNGRFWQNSPSGAHVADPDYYDYSHGVRLIKKK
jgi:hypothetical protein